MHLQILDIPPPLFLNGNKAIIILLSIILVLSHDLHILNQLENCREYSFPFSLGRIKKIVSLLVYYVCQVKADEEDEYLKNIGTQNERDDFFWHVFIGNLLSVAG